MSLACAKRCGLTELIDRRFSGDAKVAVRARVRVRVRLVDSRSSSTGGSLATPQVAVRLGLG
jgi:hypothetical protein